MAIDSRMVAFRTKTGGARIRGASYGKTAGGWPHRGYEGFRRDEHGLRALFPDTISGPDNDSGRRLAARRRRRDRGRGEIGASDAERAKPARTFDALKSLGRLGASIFGARLNRDPVSGGGVAFAAADVRLRAQHR